MTSRLGPQVDHPIDVSDDFQVVLDDDHRVSLIDQSIQHIHQFVDVVKMQTCRRFIEQEKSFPSCGPYQFRSELDPLRFASGKGWSALSEFDVTEPHIAHHPKHS